MKNYESSVQERWGTVVTGARTGFQPVPDALLRGQAELKLTNTEMVVLLNITMHWWKKDEMPYPTTNTIATRMGIQQRTVQRSIQSLVKKGLIAKIWEKPSADSSEQYRKFDMNLLVERLKPIAGKLQEFNPATAETRQSWYEKYNE